MKANIIFLSILISIQTLWSFDLELKLLGNEEYLRRGKITKVILKTTNAKLMEEFKKNNKDISLNQWLYLFSVEFVQDDTKGANTIGSTVVLKELPTSKEVEFKIAEQKYVLSFGEVKFHPDDASLTPKASMFEEIYNLQQFMLWLQKNLKILSGIILLVLAASMITFIKMRKKILNARALKLKKDNWLIKLKNAQTRQDVEKIYQAKNEWSNFYSNASIDDLLNYLNTIQYSPEWSTEQQDQLLKKLDVMKQSLS